MEKEYQKPRQTLFRVLVVGKFYDLKMTDEEGLEVLEDIVEAFKKIIKEKEGK